MSDENTNVNNAKNVSTGKPKIGGAIFRAPLGTTLPTTALEELDEAFENLGYVSEDGVTNANSISSDTIKAWGGDIVNTSQTEKSDNFSFQLIETVRVAVLKAIYGNDNVSGTLETGIEIKVNSKELEPSCWVIDTILSENVLKRMVIPLGKLFELGEVIYNGTDPVGYTPTIQALPDDESNTHYEYIQKKTTVSA